MIKTLNKLGRERKFVILTDDTYEKITPKSYLIMQMNDFLLRLGTRQ